MAADRRYWLMKSEPEVYSIDDLARDKRTGWQGVRNYQARNFMRDEMKVGDGVFFYHSSTKPQAIVGIARVSRASYPDDTQFDPKSDYYDPKAMPEQPIWFMVDIEFESKLKQPLTLEALKADNALADMTLVKRGQRLSVQPVSTIEWKHICGLAGVEA